MKFPKDVQLILKRRYRRQASQWVQGSNPWPMSIPLSPPSEQEARQKSETVRDWVLAWQTWSGKGSLIWKETHWRVLGTQSLPERLLLFGAEDVAEWVGQSDDWRAQMVFRQTFLKRWPELEQGLKFVDEDEDDLGRLVAMLEWLERNPRSNLYPRQIPVSGLDTKWLERRMDWIARALLLLRGEPSGHRDFYEIAGLRSLPHLVRMRILDARLRESVGGLSDLCAPPDEITRLKLPIRKTFIVENLQSGLAFEDIPNSVLFMGMGNGISLLSQVSWIAHTECVYWGDIDTYGFSILDQVRSFIPGVQSKLMDESTLCDHQVFWGDEMKQHPSESLIHLNPSERDVYEGLRAHRWRPNLRLEQERIPWSYAWPRLLE